jgi:hypothetical protein
MSSEQQLAANDSQPVFVTSAHPDAEEDPNEKLLQYMEYYGQLNDVIG